MRKKSLTIFAVLFAAILFGQAINSSLFAGDKNKNKSKEVYTCPMHPEVQKEEMDECPICGMDLEKAEEHDHDHDDSDDDKKKKKDKKKKGKKK